MRLRRRLGMLVAAVVAAAGIPLLAAGPAQASSYRYWSYWHGAQSACVPNPSPGWNFAGTGPGGCRLSDGDVEGWRFAVSPSARGGARPRTDPSAAASLCDKEQRSADQIRVALVLDFGTTADAPPGDAPPNETLFGDCLVLPKGATGADLLRAAGVSTRQDSSGLVCALSGYPKVGCGDAVADPVATPTTSARPTRTASPTARASTLPTRSSPPTSGRTPSPTPPEPGSSRATDRATSGTTSAAPGTVAASNGSAAAVTSRTAPADPESSPTLVVGLPAAASSGTGTPWAAGLVLVLVAGLGGGAFVRSRRSRRSP